MNLDIDTCAAALLRDALISWQETMSPYFVTRAAAHWNDGWETKCCDFLSKDMKQQVLNGRGWDVYRLAAVIAKCPSIFFPEYESLTDSAREMYRLRPCC